MFAEGSLSSIVAIFPAVAAQASPSTTHLKDAFRQLPDGPVAAPAAKYRIGTAADGSTGVRRCEQQSDHRPNGQIVEVISYKGGLRGIHS